MYTVFDGGTQKAMRKNTEKEALASLKKEKMLLAINNQKAVT